MPDTTHTHAASALAHWPCPYWAQLSTRDFALAQASGLAARTVAILPVGATEQHGPHLPLCVDSALTEGILQHALAQLPPDVPVLALPTQTIGLSVEHLAFAGTLSLQPATLLALWTELGACVARAGVKKLLIFNAHGGNVSSMDIVARQLRQQCGLLVYHCSWFNLPLPEQVQQSFSAHEHRFGIHAGAVETSMMLHLAPQLVAMEQAQHFASTSEQRAQRYAILGNGKSAKLGWAMQDYHPAGAVGDAASADAARGQALVQAAGAGLAQLLQEMAQLPPDTVGPAY